MPAQLLEPKNRETLDVENTSGPAYADAAAIWSNNKKMHTQNRMEAY